MKLGGIKNNRGWVAQMVVDGSEVGPIGPSTRPQPRNLDGGQSVAILYPLLHPQFSFKLADQEEHISVIPAFRGLTSGRTGFQAWHLFKPGGVGSWLLGIPESGGRVSLTCAYRF